MATTTQSLFGGLCGVQLHIVSFDFTSHTIKCKKPPKNYLRGSYFVSLLLFAKYFLRMYIYFWRGGFLRIFKSRYKVFSERYL